MRIALSVGVAGFFSLAISGGLLESAFAQSAKAKSKPQPAPAGQMICNSSGGCRPVKPGCKVEPSNYVGQVEVCPGEKRPI